MTDLFTHAAQQDHRAAIEALEAVKGRLDTRGSHRAMRDVFRAATEALQAEIEARRTK